MSTIDTIQVAKPPPRKLQLAHVFVVIAVTAALLAIGTQLGELAAALSIIGGAALMGVGSAWWWRNLWLFFIPPGCLMFVICVVLPSSRRAPQAARRMSCSNNMKNLALALHNYHDQHGSFPPAYVSDKNGNPLYSWRVLILPFIEQGHLYDQYRKDEPWDSSHNLALAKQMSSVFSCPTSRVKGSLRTPYVAVVGDGTMWPGRESLTFADIHDGAPNTLLIVEWPESDIIWSEPRDLPLKDLAVWSNPPAKVLNGKHRHNGGGVTVAMADGSVHFLEPDKLKPSLLDALITPAGDETVDLKDAWR